MDPAPWVGQTIDGRYLVEAVIGRGGMGIVLRAKQTFTGVQVALKLLHRELELDPEIQARFLAEAKAPNQIGHRSIVSVVDAGRTSDGTLYIAMELLVGRSLRTSLQRSELSPELQKRVMLDLLEALGHAHAKGFVHRDLKPDNVFLCGPQNDVKLLDFGIAKVLDDARKTVTGALLGTPAYMAPEQLANAAAVDSRADLWAIGVIVYEMMTGRLPIPGRNANEVLVALASAEPTPIRAYLPNVSPAVEQFFARCLARDPRMRFGAASEVAQALASLPFAAPRAPTGTMATAATGHAVPAGAVGAMQSSYVAAAAPVSTVHTAVAPAAGNKAIWIVAALAVVLIIVGIGIGMRKTDPVVASDAATPRDADVEVVEPDDNKPRTCDEKCDWLQDRCGMRFASCESDCKGLPTIWEPCYERSRVDCRDGAICGFEKLCRQELRGTGNCESALTCEVGCAQRGGDAMTLLACNCACAAKLSPQFALDLGRTNACLSRAGLECLGKTGTALETCVTGVCGSEVLACKLAR